MAETFGLGDMVWSGTELRNDGTIPDMQEDALLASPGTRGVVVKVGTVQDRPEVSVYLVRFEDSEGVLGPPVGCLTEELTQDEQLATALKNGITPNEVETGASEATDASDNSP